MKKGLVLLDIDETIIDKRYRLTVDVEILRAALRRAEDAGLEVGLNSDSALPSMQDRAREWGIKGPLLAEKSVVHIQGESPATTPIHPQLSEFTALRRAFIDKLEEMARRDASIQILSGDANAIVSNLDNAADLRTETETLVVVNMLRGHSLSCFVRKRRGVQWLADEDASAHILRILASAGESFADLWSDRHEDVNPAYGIIILHHKDSHKRTAVDHLLSLKPYERVYMIGDSYADYLDDPRVTQLAVANAHEEYRALCSVVAKSDRTAGVIELIERIVSER